MRIEKDHPDFTNALKSVEDEFNCKLSAHYALDVVNIVYRLRKKEKGPEFRALFDRALIERGGGLETQRPYILVTARYFNKRAVRAKAKGGNSAYKTEAFPQIRGNPTRSQASVEVFKDVLVSFSASKEDGLLAWDDVTFGDLHPAVGRNEVSKARKMALAIMNSRRK